MVADAVDGFVGPLGGGGGKGGGVLVAGGGVLGEEVGAFAIGTVHLEFDEIEEGGEALLGPAKQTPFC